jgi:hypothetical protein
VTKVAERTLAALEAIPGVQAAALETPATSVSTGLQPEEAARARIGVPDNDNLRAIEASYRYRIDESRAVRARPILGAGTLSSRPERPSCRRATARTISSNGPTTRSIARRSSARRAPCSRTAPRSRARGRARRPSGRRSRAAVPGRADR